MKFEDMACSIYVCERSVCFSFEVTRSPAFGAYCQHLTTSIAQERSGFPLMLITWDYVGKGDSMYSSVVRGMAVGQMDTGFK